MQGNVVEVFQAIDSRKSIRGFKSTPVPTSLINQVFTAANRTPSYANSQPWEVAVVMGSKRDELSEKIYGLASSNAPINPDFEIPKNWPPAIEQRTKDHGARRFKALNIERDDAESRNALRLMNFKFFDAPCAVFFFMDGALNSWSSTDVGMYIHSVSLCAHALGLGTCLQASLAYYPEALRQVLGISSTKKLLLGLSLGYPDWEVPLNSYTSTKMNLDEYLRIYN